MKLATIALVVFAASFSLVAAQSANIDPTPAPYKIDMVQRPTPVYVLNFPEVQAVAGTVAVSNLPAVQTVGGTVNVGNLPLDTDGAVRVASASTRAPVMFELVSAPFSVDAYGLTFPDTLDTTGYSAIAVYADAAPLTTAQVLWRWTGDGPDDFAPVFDLRGSTHNDSFPIVDCAGAVRTKFVCSTLGGSVRIRLSFSGYTANRYVNSVRVYLFP